MDEYEVAVMRALKPDYDMLVAATTMHAHINDFAAGAALADLKKRGYIAFEGRGRFKSFYMTDEGKAAYAELPEEAAA